MKTSVSRKIIVSQGLTILHFPEVATSIEAKGNEVTYITGWIPSFYQKPIANFFGRLLNKKNLYARLIARKPKITDDRIIKLTLCEIYYWLLSVGAKLKFLSVTQVNVKAWTYFGKCSAKYIDNQSIFHLRSGTGQGGAILKAKSKNIITVADHSIAHPAEMDRVLSAEYAKYGLPFELGANDDFWKIIILDCHQSDYVLVNSDYVAQTFIANGFRAEKIKVIYLGVREDFLGLKNNWNKHQIPKLLFTGTFSVRKGAHILLEAVEILNQNGLVFSLDVVGPDEFTGAYNKPLPANINMVGNVIQDDLKQYLANSDIYVFPTLSEGCAKSVMEAMAAGLPVVTTVNSGAPIVDNESGFLAEVGSVQSLVNKIKIAIDNNELRQYIGKHTISLVENNYSWRNYAYNLSTFYNEVLNNQY
ncbi:glycosyltransferase family 4 protein [Mucilaginibacter ximonensis]|uniref:Glycosyltransferase family 4 protein n=1 Tax=Mucilaginibacter ximonensis TaxID=538021 RepID=A0ABW5YEZ2_9SPHI